MENRPEICLLRPDQIARHFELLRIPHPEAQAAMVKSIQAYGQLSPVVVGKLPTEYELVDGFKRLHAAEVLGTQSLRAQVLSENTVVLKAAIIGINRSQCRVNELEEALVLQSLHREDKIAQTEIALLCGRDKSWVCRRIAMIEQLCEEALEHIRLGLLSVAMARYLRQLPRGNQPQLVATIIEHNLSVKQLQQLVVQHKRVDQRGWEHLLRNPIAVAAAGVVPKVAKSSREIIHRMEADCRTLISTTSNIISDTAQHTRVCDAVSVIENSLLRIRILLQEWEKQRHEPSVSNK